MYFKDQNFKTFSRCCEVKKSEIRPKSEHLHPQLIHEILSIFYETFLPNIFCRIMSELLEINLETHHVSKFHILIERSTEDVAISGLRIQTSRPIT